MTDPFARYHRQMILPGLGEAGQRRLARAHAVIVGCGALGCTSADLLARAGVGVLTIIDRDLVELTNLQRQVLFDEADAHGGIPKAAAAARRLAQINSAIAVHPHITDLRAQNAEQLILGSSPTPPDIILDGTDNFETRFILNDLSVKHSIAYAYAGVVAGRGMTALFDPGAGGPCLRCLFDAPPPPGSQPTCDTAGVFGPAVAIVAGAQTGEALKHLLGLPTNDSLLDFDLFAHARRRLGLADLKRPDCPCCSRHDFAFLNATDDTPAALCGQSAVQVHPPVASAALIDLPALAGRLRAAGDRGSVRANAHLIRATLDRGRLALTVFADGRAIIKGVDTPEAARSIYARYIGL